MASVAQCLVAVERERHFGSVALGGGERGQGVHVVEGRRQLDPVFLRELPELLEAVYEGELGFHVCEHGRDRLLDSLLSVQADAGVR